VSDADLSAPPILRAEAGDGADVTAYLPDAAEDGANFVTFRPSATKTPALRSGTIDPSAPYTFSLPKNRRWKARAQRRAAHTRRVGADRACANVAQEAKVANAISGNYCQARVVCWQHDNTDALLTRRPFVAPSASLR
jgi:hypothetical protein